MKKQKILFFLILFFITCFALFVRLYTYLQCRPLWHDECSLALSIIKYNIWGYFSALENYQSAPPLFMMLTKFVTMLGGIKENCLRLIPLLSSVLSLPMFYYLSKKFLYKKWVILIAFLLMAINKNLIYYAQEFKQYSTDVLVFLCLLFVVINIDFSKFSNKKAFLIGIIFALFPLLSFPSIFVIASLIMYEFIKYKKVILKKLVCFLTPLFVIMIIYCLTTLLPQYFGQANIYMNYWNQGFITFNFINIYNLIKTNLLYYFYPNQYLLPLVCMLLGGIIIMFKSLKEKGCSIFLLTFMFIIMASFLQIYPIFQRVSLYILPMLIILLVKPLDEISFNTKMNTKIVSFLIIAFWVLSVFKYDINYFKNMASSVVANNYDARKITSLLKQKYDKKDCIIINNASVSEYGYYATYFDLKTSNYWILRMANNEKQEYFKALDSLPDGNYWFYCAYDYSHSPIISYLKEWSVSKDVLYEYNEKNSYLLYVKL